MNQPKVANHKVENQTEELKYHIQTLRKSGINTIINKDENLISFQIQPKIIKIGGSIEIEHIYEKILEIVASVSGWINIESSDLKKNIKELKNVGIDTIINTEKGLVVFAIQPEITKTKIGGFIGIDDAIGAIILGIVGAVAGWGTRKVISKIEGSGLKTYINKLKEFGIDIIIIKEKDLIILNILPEILLENFIEIQNDVSNQISKIISSVIDNKQKKEIFFQGNVVGGNCKKKNSGKATETACQAKEEVKFANQPIILY